LKTRQRMSSLGGVAGPALFVAAWVASGRRTVGYSPLGEPISRLAARRCACRPAMTAGFLAYTIGVGGFATRVDVLGRPAATATAANAVAMGALAALPLSDAGNNRAHVAAAGAAYVSLTLVPLLAAYRDRQAVHRRAAAATAGLAAGSFLALSVIHPSGQGGWQRAGLTAGQAWIASTAGWDLLGGNRVSVTRSTIPR
jgi:hypothetical protein